MASHQNIPLEQIGGGNHIDDVRVDIEGATNANYAASSSQSADGLRYRPSNRSATSQDTNVDDLISRLPSAVLANAVQGVVAGQTWRAKSRKSRKSRPGYQTVRGKPDTSDPQEMAKQLMEDQEFVDAPEQIQNQGIRDLPTNLANKMEVKAEVDKTKGKEKKPSTFKTMGYSMSLAWKRFKQNVDEINYSVNLWAEHLKKIEGHFGSGVTSYFLFIKFLFLLNIPTFLLILFFIVLPQLLYRYIEMGGYNNTMAFSAEQIFTGSGWLNETELYYGEYTNETINIVSGLYYYITYAYLFTMGVCYVGILITVALNLTKSYRKNYIEASDEFNFYYVSKVFCGWSYSMDDPDSAYLKHKSIFKEFQEYLSGFRKEEEKQTCDQWCSLFLLRIATNILTAGLIGGSGYLVWYISITQSLSNNIAFISEMALPLCISAINFILPFAFSILASFEKYKSPRIELYFTMTRTILLNLVTLGVLIYFWFSSVDCSKVDLDDQRWLDSELECRPCWETFMGENLYRLVIVAFKFILAIAFVSEFIRSLMSRLCCKSLGGPEFNIGRNTLSLIYSQGLIWLGMFYSPILPLIMIVKLFVIFYVKRVSVMSNCVPSVKPWRGGRTHTIILGLLFVFYILCMAAFGYSIVFLKPSEECGPYQGLNASYEVVTDLINKWKGNNQDANRILTAFLEVITSVAFVVGLFIFLCIVAHYSRVVSKGHQEMVTLLRNQISLEGKDKAFLLRLLQQASKNLPAPSCARVPGDKGSVRGRGTGGKQFAKYAVQHTQHTPSGTPSSPRRGTPGGGGGSHSKATTPSSHHTPSSRHPYTPETHNQNFLEQSMDMGPGSQGSYPGSLQVTPMDNPGYRDKSPTHRPNLPYPGTPYDKRL